jgi:protein-S-isoprenylcysteine O-methyltransferase Ste14
MMRIRSLARWIVPGLFAAAAASTGIHAAGSVGHALTQGSMRAWLVVLYGVLRMGVACAFALFTIGRAAPRRPSRSPVAFLACALAMGAVIAFSDPVPSTPEELVVAGELVAVAFCVWLLVSVLFLGRCFGVLPEARGMVTRGPYRLVRHPVYLGEIGACAGLALAAPSLANLGLLTALMAAQAVRLRMEERALTRAFPQYVEYAARTPRLVPRPSLLRTVSLAGTPTLHANWTQRSEPAVSTLAEPTGPA